jgi:hypothetical protein
VDLGDHYGYEVEHNGDRNQIEGDFVNFDERRAEVPHGLIGRLVDQLGGTRLDDAEGRVLRIERVSVELK